MSDLRVDLGALETLQSSMRAVRNEFEHAEAFSHTVADYVGHDGLASTVRDFADKWNLRRSELLEEMELVAEAAKSIHDTMIELDQSLAETIAAYRPDVFVGGGGGGGGGGGR